MPNFVIQSKIFKDWSTGNFLKQLYIFRQNKFLVSNRGSRCFITNYMLHVIMFCLPINLKQTVGGSDNRGELLLIVVADESGDG